MQVKKEPLVAKCLKLNACLLGGLCFAILWGVWIGGKMLGFYLFPQYEIAVPVSASLGFFAAIATIGAFGALDERFDRENSN